MIKHDEFLKGLSLARRKKIRERANELLAEELTLRQLRQAREQSQEELAEVLGIRQGDLSKLEHRADAYLSTVRRYVEALGGKLDLIASFPKSKPVKITHIGDFAQDETYKERLPEHAHQQKQITQNRSKALVAAHSAKRRAV